MIHLTDRALYGDLRLPLAVWHGIVEAPSGNVVADSAKVLFVTAGWASLTCGRETVPLQPGSIVVIPRRMIFAVSPVGFLQGVGIYLRPDFLDAHLRWLPDSHPLMRQLRIAHRESSTAGVVDVSDHGMRTLRARLSVVAALSGAPASEFALLARVADVFDQVAFLVSYNSGVGDGDALHRPAIPRTPVATAARLLHENLRHAWTVSELARQVAISESQLSRLFRQDLGVSPASYLWGARTDRMAELLAESDITVAEASQAVGWGRGSASGRAFKRRYGMSPRAFVAAAREPGPLLRETVLGHSSADVETEARLVSQAITGAPT